MTSNNDKIDEVIAAWPEVLKILRDYETAFPYAEMQGDDDKVYRMDQAIKRLKGDAP